jgi:hypothetical protein
MKRLVFIAVSLVLLQFCSAQNYIVNGNFTEPSPIAPPKTYEFTNSLTGWTSSADGGKL